MADPLGSLEKIVKLALRIKEAADTVRHNREECQQIRTRALRVSTLLSRLPETGITGDPAMCDALGDLEDALHHAHALVTDCQQGSTLCLYCTAAKQARRLRRVQDDISQKVMLVVFATNIHTTIILTNTITCSRDPDPLLSRQPQVMRAQPVVVHSNSSADDARPEIHSADLEDYQYLFEDSSPERSMMRWTPLNDNVSFEEEVDGAADNIPMGTEPEPIQGVVLGKSAALNSPHSAGTSNKAASPREPNLRQQGEACRDRTRDRLATHPDESFNPYPSVAIRRIKHKIQALTDDDLFPVPPQSVPLPQAPLVGNGTGLATAIGHEVARHGIKLAAQAVAISLFTPDSSTDMQEADDGGTASILDIADSRANEHGDELPEPWNDIGLRKFSFSELEAATHHFSVQNMVGSGSFATVYKGVLHGGLLVAVKKFQHPNVLSAGNKNKLHLHSKLKHSNIVKLIGYNGEVLERVKCLEDGKAGAKEDKGTSYLLVEEYMPNGSLDKAINNGIGLDWSSHFCLIQGIAHGLCYLHEQDVIHLDIKPSNILLDSNMNPKITDFGLAKVLNQNGVDLCSYTGTIEGTLRYMPPEYITDGTLSKKHDVYGFGVTLLDIVSGMTRSERATGQASIEWAWQARQLAGGMTELLNTSLFDAQQLKEIERCVEVGLLCTQFDPADRPDMVDALEMLRGKKALRTPVRPGYTNKEPAARGLRRWGWLRVMRL